jgi:hypothetical protein
MAIPSYIGAQINPDTNTFETWLERTNSLITDMGSTVLTVGLSDNVGNTFIQGTFSANTIAVPGDLRGGTVSTPGPLIISSNTSFTANTLTIGSTVTTTTTGDVNFTGGSRTFTITNATTTINSTSLVINSNTSFSNTITFSELVTMDDLTVEGILTVSNLNILGTPTFTSLEVTGSSLFSDITVSGNTISNNILAENLTVSANTSLNLLAVSGNTSLSNTSIVNLSVSNTAAINILSVTGSTTLNTLSANTGSFVNLSVTGTLTGNTVTASTTTTTNLTVSGTGATRISTGAQTLRPVSPVQGMIRFNTTAPARFEGYDGSSWLTISDTLLTVSGNGLIVKDTSGNGITRTITQGNGILVTNGSGVDGNPTIAARFATNSEMFAGTANRVINSGALYSANAPVSVNYANAINLDNGRNFTGTLTANINIPNPTNQKAGQSGMIIIRQDSVGGRTVTWSPNWRFSGGISSLTSAPNSIDVVSYFVESSGTVLCTITRGF